LNCILKKKIANGNKANGKNLKENGKESILQNKILLLRKANEK
jgi:hypothetical protein